MKFQNNPMCGTKVIVEKPIGVAKLPPPPLNRVKGSYFHGCGVLWFFTGTIFADRILKNLQVRHCWRTTSEAEISSRENMNL